MNAGHPIRLNLIVALSVILLGLLALTVKKNAGLRNENSRLIGDATLLTQQLGVTVAERDTLRADSSRIAAQLAEATNSTSLHLAASEGAQQSLHQKLRAEITRLSEDNVLKESQLDTLRSQIAAVRQEQARIGEAWRLATGSAAAFSNEVKQVRASEADKSARLALREQELATARATAQQAAAAQAAADLNAKTAQTELATLKARVAELEGGKAGTVTPPTVIK